MTRVDFCAAISSVTSAYKLSQIGATLHTPISSSGRGGHGEEGITEAMFPRRLYPIPTPAPAPKAPYYKGLFKDLQKHHTHGIIQRGYCVLCDCGLPQLYHTHYRCQKAE